MNRAYRTLIVFGVTLVGGSLPASADFILTANITHDQETVQGAFITSTGDPRPQSFGTGWFTLNDAKTALSFTATIFNIDVTGSQTPDPNDDLRAAHIHANATVVVGQNAPVVWGFFGNPFNDNNPNNTTLTPFSSGVGGVFQGVWDLPEGQNTTLAAQLPNILSGHSYINFHTVQFGGGEIRGALIPVPDSGSSMALLGCGLLGLVGIRRKLITAKA